jgi:hypothetical protein
MATAADAASAPAVERKPRRVVLVELVIDFLALPKVEGSMVRAGRMLTHPSRSFFNPAHDRRAVNLVMAPPSAGIAFGFKW